MYADQRNRAVDIPLSGTAWGTNSFRRVGDSNICYTVQWVLPLEEGEDNDSDKPGLFLMRAVSGVCASISTRRR